MKTVEKIKDIVSDFLWLEGEARDIGWKVGLIRGELDNRRSSYLSFTADWHSKLILVNFENWGGGSSEITTIEFPISYLWSPDYEEQAKTAHAEQQWLAIAARLASDRIKEAEQLADERAIYEKLKLKFDPKD